MITQKDVKYIASLSRINLKEQEVGRLTKNLEAILHYIEKLKKVDVSQVQPTSHVFPLNNVFREDVVQPSLHQDKAIKISQNHHQGSFKVPKVIE
ncbi:MAG: asparaginyl/glutamyl-tRNA amidotransferase subunit C [Omnitrophica WOR_2 bacterium RIFCSPHIGHO2_02_FULL_48_11]|nr:MAG: asparaginyl/glutamyl-tRNA amidotransferase subunit C [Omnitrophica WOR_2 bacterium RIFCSPHIGHO2_02_FULL_48_11]